MQYFFVHCIYQIGLQKQEETRGFFEFVFFLFPLEEFSVLHRYSNHQIVSEYLVSFDNIPQKTISLFIMTMYPIMQLQDFD